MDGGFGSWNYWSGCSTSCGVGVQTRSRVCDSPYPINGGSVCVGASKQNRKCTIRTCSGDFCPFLVVDIFCFSVLIFVTRNNGLICLVIHWSQKRQDRATFAQQWGCWWPYWKGQFNTFEFKWAKSFVLTIVEMGWMISMILDNPA